MIAFVVVAVASMAAGAYLEHKFGSSVVARITALEARVATAEDRVRHAKVKIAQSVFDRVAQIGTAVSEAKKAVEQKL